MALRNVAMGAPPRTPLKEAAIAMKQEDPGRFVAVYERGEKEWREEMLRLQEMDAQRQARSNSLEGEWGRELTAEQKESEERLEEALAKEWAEVKEALALIRSRKEQRSPDAIASEAAR